MISLLYINNDEKNQFFAFAPCGAYMGQNDIDNSLERFWYLKDNSSSDED
jgi:hypothetical protein